MASLQKLTAMSDQHSKQRDSLIEKLIAALLHLWVGFGKPDDPILTAGLAAQSASITQTAIDSARRLERSYITAQFRELGVPTRDLPAPLTGPARAGDVSQTNVWQRPVQQWIWARRQAESEERQKATFDQRLRNLATEAIVGASRDEASNLYGSRKTVTGYRRVIHPELSREGTCGLCIVASQRVYRSGELMPLHPGCHCDTMAITSGDDPGLRLNTDDIAKVYAEAGSTGAAALRETRFVVHEHGELGPLLVREGDHFRTPSEAGADRFKRPTPESIRAAQQAELKQLTGLIADANQAFDDFIRENPRISWRSEDQQRASDLQRAAGRLRIRQSQLQTLLSAQTTGH